MKLNEIINIDMKLFEIIDLKTKEIFNSPKTGEEYLRQNKSNKKGSFSWVEDDKDPFFISKKHLIDTPEEEDPALKDGFYVYLNKIKNKMKENPFFPRVYEMEKHYNKGIDSNSRINSTVEKLFPLNELDFSLQDSLVNQLFDLNKFIEEMSPISSQNMFSITGFDKAAKSLMILKKVSKKMAYFLTYLRYIKYIKSSVNFIKNKKLKEALDLILNSTKTVDLHYDNVMFRRTPYGPQLVLADPLSY